MIHTQPEYIFIKSRLPYWITLDVRIYRDQDGTRICSDAPSTDTDLAIHKLVRERKITGIVKLELVAKKIRLHIKPVFGGPFLPMKLVPTNFSGVTPKDVNQ